MRHKCDSRNETYIRFIQNETHVALQTIQLVLRSTLIARRYEEPEET